MQDPASSTAPKELNSLVKSVVKAVDKWTSEGSLRRVRTEVVVGEPVYAEGSLTLGYHREDREHWDQVALQNLLRKLREDEEGGRNFEEAVAVLAEEARISEDRIPTLRGDLVQFLHAVGRRAADDPVELDAGQLAERFVHEIGGGELIWRGRVWLQGLVVDGDPLVVDDGTTLRQPVSDDFAFEMPAESAMFGAGLDHLMKSPDSVLEMSRSGVNRPDHDTYRIANSLCLYDLGAVTPIKHGFSSDSLFRPSHTSWPHTRFSPSFRYSVSRADVEPLRRFIDKVALTLPVKPTGTHEDKRWNALKFYFRALFNASDDEERLAQSVGSLESILTTDSPENLSFRLSQREASLLRLAGFRLETVFDDMRKTYKVRSAYAHGRASNVDRNELRALCTRIMNYARLTVVNTLHMSVGDRKKLGRRLDDSLLDDEVLGSLRDELVGGTWDLVRKGDASHRETGG